MDDFALKCLEQRSSTAEAAPLIQDPESDGRESLE
jgi:hypothetical protein